MSNQIDLLARLEEAETEISRLRVVQCTSPFPDSLPCRGIQKERDVIQCLRARLDWLMGNMTYDDPGDGFAWLRLARRVEIFSLSPSTKEEAVDLLMKEDQT